MKNYKDGSSPRVAVKGLSQQKKQETGSVKVSVKPSWNAEGTERPVLLEYSERGEKWSKIR